MSLGNNFYNARKKSGLSQEEVAGKLGISRQTVSKWEKDILANVWKNRKNNIPNFKNFISTLSDM
ncbi:XRE family transcriptional regulator [Clostridiaceae bacterium]|nr:XRE family transcriptional regulator [Clostridiaceae bacterium]